LKINSGNLNKWKQSRKQRELGILNSPISQTKICLLFCLYFTVHSPPFCYQRPNLQHGYCGLDKKYPQRLICLVPQLVARWAVTG
jgi:hypothetical protein